MKTTNKYSDRLFSLPKDSGLIKKSFVHAGIAFLFLTFSACSTIKLQQNQLTEDKRENLPQNIKTADEDVDISKETSCIISVDDVSGTFFIGKEKITEAQLTEKISAKMQDKSPDKRIVYIKSATVVQYRTIVKLLNSIRKADVDKVGFVAFKKNYEKLGSNPSRIEVKLPIAPSEEAPNKRPNPLFLVVTIEKTGALRLNMEQMGNIGDTTNLTNKLSEVFKDRESNGVFREGTNEVEKTVFVKAPLSLNYGDVIKVIDVVKLSGAQPIGIQIDDLSE